MAASRALAGFGLDSTVESLSAVVAILIQEGREALTAEHVDDCCG